MSSFLRENADVIIKTDPEIRAHSQILSARSEYFRALLSTTWAKKNEKGMFVIESDQKQTVMHIIVTYLYSDTLLEIDNVELTIELLKESDKLLLNDLSSKIYKRLRLIVPTFSSEEIIILVELLFKCESLYYIFESTLHYIMQDIGKLVFDTDAKFNNETFKLLLKRDDLGMTEKELFRIIKKNNYDIDLEEL
ncbi:629_t:CDS:1, partial [Dentiscutata heterogama]